MNLVRKNIANITPYISGKPIEETKRELGLREVIKLASNENPLGPSPMAVAAIKKNLKKINRYPDSSSFYLKKRLAKKYNVNPENVLAGNGSDEIIDIIIKAFVEDDENIITSEVTFLEYEIISKVNNREVVTVPLKNFKYDLGAIKAKVNPKTKLIFIANPNNPTGTYVTRQEIADLLKGLPENVILVLDEAYETFIDVADFPDTLQHIGSRNVILMKTFSKVFGLAGLRVGYAIADSKLIMPMEKVRQPFNVNLLAQAAAVATIDDKKFIQKTRKVVLEGKNYFYAELKKMGLNFVPSVANFVLIDLKTDCMDIFLDLLKQGIIVRDMKQYKLDNFIRVTIGTKRENQKFIEALKKVL